MKLNFFTSQTMPKGSWGKTETTPAVTFTKSGIIDINAAAATLMKLTPKDKISLAQDETDPGNWYFFKDPGNGYTVRSTDFEKTKKICFNHSGLRRSFIESLGLDTETTHRFLIVGTPTVLGKQEFWGILVNTAQ